MLLQTGRCMGHTRCKWAIPVGYVSGSMCAGVNGMSGASGVEGGCTRCGVCGQAGVGGASDASGLSGVCGIGSASSVSTRTIKWVGTCSSPRLAEHCELLLASFLLSCSLLSENFELLLSLSALGLDDCASVVQLTLPLPHLCFVCLRCVAWEGLIGEQGV